MSERIEYKLDIDIVDPTPSGAGGQLLNDNFVVIADHLETNDTRLTALEAVGVSGYSGYSGISGYSGYSGYSGVSGFSGYSGLSGYSGYSGVSGYSGYSGISGYSGYSGVSGYSGYSGSGVSGYSGYSGISGYSGYSAVIPNPIALADGTVSAPSLTFAAETSTGIYRVGDFTLGISAITLDVARFSSQGLTINEQGDSAIDTRIEGDTIQYLLYADSSLDRIGINQSAPEKVLHVGQSNQSNDGILIGGAGRLYFRDTSCIYEANGLVIDSANSARPIILQFNSSERARFGSTENVINEAGVDADFRIESDANTHALYLDAGADSAKGLWGIRVSSPASLLDIDSTASTTVYALNLKGGDTGGGSRIFKITNALNAVIYDFRGDGTVIHNMTASGSTYTLQFQANSRFSVSSTESVFNDVQGNYDFRVEGDSISHMVFCDATSTTENIALLATAAPNWQAMDRGIFIGETSAAPTGNPTSGGFLYVESGALKYRGSSGTITTVGPA